MSSQQHKKGGRGVSSSGGGVTSSQRHHSHVSSTDSGSQSHHHLHHRHHHQIQEVDRQIHPAGIMSSASSTAGGGLSSSRGIRSSGIRSSSSSSRQDSIRREDLEDEDEQILYSSTAMATNAQILDYSKTSMSALSGCAAGILGLTGISGFAFYLISSLILSLMLSVKASFQFDKYVTSKWSFLTSGFLGGLFTYVLFWTFLYGMVYVY